jgi:heterodisulfide reductase subunit B
MKQEAVNRRYGKKLGMVVYYLSDLVGLAMEISAEQLGIDRHFVTKA